MKRGVLARQLGIAVALLALGSGPAHAAPFAYVANFGDARPATRIVSQYDVDAGGLLAPLSPPGVRPAGEPTGVAVSPDGKSVYVSSLFGESGIYQFDAGPGGALSPKSPAHVAGNGFAAVVVSPDGGSVYAVVPTLPGIVYQYDAGPGGRLSPKSPPSVAAGANPDGVAVSPDSESVYVASGNGILQWDAAPDGSLSPKSPPAVEIFRAGPSDVVVSPDGKSAYAAASGPYLGKVIQFDVGRDETLSPKDPPTVPAGIRAATAIAVHPNGESVYVTKALAIGVPSPPPRGSVFQFDVGPGGRLSPKTPARVVAGIQARDVALRPPPTSRTQCETGGWSQFGFSNQGRCVASVEDR